MPFQDTPFFNAYRQEFGRLTTEQVNGISFLLQALGGDTRFGVDEVGNEMIAYCLATWQWETAHTMQPIDEYGTDAYFNAKYGPQTAAGRGLGNTQDGDGAKFHGRGYVQLTGRANYRHATERLHATSHLSASLDLEVDPQDAKAQPVAYEIAVAGMLEGWFTGKKLGTYFSSGKVPDYTNARRIINGLDHASQIAANARGLFDIVKSTRT